MTNEEINFYSMLANWFAAIGTISAVIVALWLSYRDRKVSLKVWLYEATILTEYEGSIKVVSISIVNVGLRSVLINGLTWKIPYYKKYYFGVFNDREINQVDLPFKLNEGERIDLSIRAEHFEEMIGKIIKENNFKKFIFSRLEVLISTSSGKRFKSKLNKDFQKYLKIKFDSVSNILKDEQESKNTK